MQEIAEKIETVALAWEEAQDGWIKNFYAWTWKYAISDYDQKEQWWEGYFYLLKKKVRNEVIKIKLLIYDHVWGDC